eukprot:s267_g9.t1
MPGAGLDEQAASQMGAAMADLERSKPSKAHQGAALLRKRCLTLRRNRRAMLCLCLLPMIFNILGIASIATSFELDSPPLEIFGTSQALNPEAKQQKPVVVAFGASGSATLGEQHPARHQPQEPLGVSDHRRQCLGRPSCKGFLKIGFMSGAAPATGSSERSLTGRLKVGLQDQAMLSLDAGQREAKVQFMFGEAAMKVDVKRAEEQRQELAQCASGGPMQLQLAEEALRRLDEDTQKNLVAMQAGVTEEAPPMDVEILAFVASPEQVPSERLEDLQRCARWQAFAEALLETRHALKASRYGGIFVERLNLKSRSPKGRLAIFQNTSVFHSDQLAPAPDAPPENFGLFKSGMDAMDDSGAPGMSTPEHWSDVGPLSGRLQVVEQQVQAVQAHIAHLSSQMAVVGQSMQQVEMQLMMQQKQHEDLMKLLVNCMAPQDRHLAELRTFQSLELGGSSMALWENPEINRSKG